MAILKALSKNICHKSDYSHSNTDLENIKTLFEEEIENRNDVLVIFYYELFLSSNESNRIINDLLIRHAYILNSYSF